MEAPGAQFPSDVESRNDFFGALATLPIFCACYPDDLRTHPHDVVFACSGRVK
jgi:hypothetical protein